MNDIVAKPIVSRQKLTAKVIDNSTSHRMILTEQRRDLLNSHSDVVMAMYKVHREYIAELQQLAKSLTSVTEALSVCQKAIDMLPPEKAAPPPEKAALEQPPKEVPKLSRRGPRGPRGILTSDERREVMRLLGEGVSRKELCSRYGVSIATIDYWAKKSKL